LKGSKLLKLFALLTVLMLIAAACGGDDGGDEGGDIRGNEDVDVSGDLQPGGELKIAGSSDTDYMDPSSTYYTLGFFLARGVHRTMVTYPGNVTDLAAQNSLVPDLAESVGQANEDFTEWTYTIKDGVTYGKALGGDDVAGVTGEQIACDDFVYSFERLFIPSVGAGYPFYYDIVEGAGDFSDGKADSISGLSCTDDRTLVISLSEPAADWDFRMAMPAMTPIPRAAAEQYDKKDDSDYDRHVVATGPYYISEWTPGEQISLARNENWDPDTDDAREAYPDSVSWKLGFDNDVGVQAVLDSEFDLAMDVSPQGPVLEEVVGDPELADRLLQEPSGCTRYLFMNTTIAPFDQPEVRQAVNWAIDRENIKRVFGGPTTGPIATSIVPPGIDGHLPSEEYNFFETPNMAGDMEKAKEMFQAAIGAETWDDPIKLVGASDPPHDKIFETVRADLEELGFTNIDGKTPKFPNQYTQFYSVPDSETAFGSSAGWCKDYQSAFTFLDPLFHSANILPSGNQNYAELDDAQMDGLIDAAAASPLGDEQTTAWEEANKYATESAVWVPWSWDDDLILYGDTIDNVYYLGFHSHVDWVNIALKEAQL
jgi:peptide/nickel transport system substrate-binding protein